jgi:hypothetical protein
MNYKDEHSVINFSHTIYNSVTGEEEVREFTKRCNILNAPNLEELESILTDFTHMLGFNYVLRVEAITNDCED